MSAYISRLYDHLAWADTRTIEALRTMHAPPLDALRLLGHLLAAEEVWLTRLQERPSDIAIWPSLVLEDCAALARKNHASFAAFIQANAGDGLQRQARYRNSKGAEFVNSAEDILLHVALHGSYHRGQVSRIIRAEGGTPLYTDYIMYVRETAAPRTQG
jgi:uncharacterized damage-inducible protein DinB